MKKRNSIGIIHSIKKFVAKYGTRHEQDRNIFTLLNDGPRREDIKMISIDYAKFTKATSWTTPDLESILHADPEQVQLLPMMRKLAR